MTLLFFVPTAPLGPPPPMGANSIMPTTIQMTDVGQETLNLEKRKYLDFLDDEVRRHRLLSLSNKFLLLSLLPHMI